MTIKCIPNRSSISSLITKRFNQENSNIFSAGALSLLTVIILLNISNFLFHLITSHLFQSSDYGLLNTLLGIISFISIPISAIQVAFTFSVSKYKVNLQDFSIRSSIKNCMLIGGVVALLLCAFAKHVDAYFHISSKMPFIIIALWVPFAIISAVLQGALIGSLNFQRAAIALGIGSVVLRPAIGILLIKIGCGVSGAIAATLLAQMFTTLLLIFYSKKHLRRHQVNNVRISFKSTLVTLSALLGYTLFINIDTFLTRHYFDPDTAGIYSASAIGAHIVFFAPSALVAIVAPLLATENNNKTFLLSLKITAVVSSLVTLTFLIFPTQIIKLLFGAKYIAASLNFRILSIASMLIGLTLLFVYYHIAKKSMFALAPWFGIILTIALIRLHHSSSTKVALIILSSSAVNLLIISSPVVIKAIKSTND
jgi:O-antigen/teichoic acid export membrane protein